MVRLHIFGALEVGGGRNEFENLWFSLFAYSIIHIFFIDCLYIVYIIFSGECIVMYYICVVLYALVVFVWRMRWISTMITSMILYTLIINYK